MYLQTSILSEIETATRLKERGMEQAVNHANQVHPKWSEEAYKFLLTWLSHKPSGYKFQIEEVRAAAEGTVPEPPSKRAFGAIAAKARRAGHIVAIGTKPVKNIKAHRCYSTVWVKTLQ